MNQHLFLIFITISNILSIKTNLNYSHLLILSILLSFPQCSPLPFYPIIFFSNFFVKSSSDLKLKEPWRWVKKLVKILIKIMMDGYIALIHWEKKRKCSQRLFTFIQILMCAIAKNVISL